MMPFMPSQFGGSPKAPARDYAPELYAARYVTVGQPLMMSTGFDGTHLALDRVTLDPVRFKLTEDLYQCGSATAQQMFYDASADDYCTAGGEITVYDSIGLGGSGSGSGSGTSSVLAFEGDWGLARYHPDSGRLEVFQTGSGCCQEGSGSGGLPPTCLQDLSHRKPSDIPGYTDHLPDNKQFLSHERDCFLWRDTKVVELMTVFNDADCTYETKWFRVLGGPYDTEAEANDN